MNETAERTEIDPVCGMTVTLKPDTRTAEFDGRTATENDVLHAAFATGGIAA